MKRIHSLILAATCLLLATASAAGATFSNSVKGAQAALTTYLKNQRIDSQIDKADNSLNFKYNGHLFYITFEEQNSGILYTLHRKAMKIESGPMDLRARRIENAATAANMMNAQYPFKTFVKGNRIDFVYPAFAKTPEDYIKVFPTMLKSMDGIQNNFDRLMKSAKVRNDSIHQFWAQNDTSVVVVPQPRNQGVVSSPNVGIGNVDFKVVGADGSTISDYGQSIRKSDIKFIQPRIVAQATKKGQYHIGMVIITPDGKTLVPVVRSNRTVISTKEIDKKPTEIELDTFGSKDGAFWQAGEYKVKFYEDNHLIKETSFTVL